MRYYYFFEIKYFPEMYGLFVLLHYSTCTSDMCLKSTGFYIGNHGDIDFYSVTETLLTVVML